MFRVFCVHLSFLSLSSKFPEPGSACMLGLDGLQPYSLSISWADLSPFEEARNVISTLERYTLESGHAKKAEASVIV